MPCDPAADKVPIPEKQNKKTQVIPTVKFNLNWSGFVRDSSKQTSQWVLPLWSQKASLSRIFGHQAPDPPDHPDPKQTIKYNKDVFTGKKSLWILSDVEVVQPTVSPHPPKPAEWHHSQCPTTVRQTPQIFYCWFQSPASGWSAACEGGAEAGTGWNGVSLGILTKQDYSAETLKNWLKPFYVLIGLKNESVWDYKRNYSCL